MNIRSLGSNTGNNGNGILRFEPSDKMIVYKSYMPFLKHGGVYVPTTNVYAIGNEVFVVAKLPDSSDYLPIAGKVVWVNQSKAVTRPAGIGIAFDDTPENAMIREKIEKCIVGMSFDVPTYTM